MDHGLCVDRGDSAAARTLDCFMGAGHYVGTMPADEMEDACCTIDLDVVGGQKAEVLRPSRLGR